jgi:hypothetical protein
LNEGEVVGRELVVACCHSPTLLDLVEEPFDEISSAVQIRAEAERVFPIALFGGIREITDMAGAVGGLVPVANDPLRSLPLRQIELPGDTKSIGEPSKSRAEAIVSQWHLHVTALGKPLERSVQVGSPVEIDEQRHRGCKIKPVGYWTVDNNQWVPVKVDPGNFYEPRSVIARPIFIHGHDSEAWKDRREQINRCLRSAALKHEVSAYGHHWKILQKIS